MSEENSNQPVDINDDNQTDFEKLFYAPEPEEVEDVEEIVDQEEEVDDLGEDDDPPAPEEDEDDDEPVEEKPQGKKKNSFQERINELTAKARAEERERIRERTEFEKRIAELESVVKKEAVKDQKPLREQLPDGAPSPEAKGEDGEPLYPLGEFDPQYIRDLTKFTIAEESKRAKEEAAKEAQAREYQEYQEAVRDHWVEKVAEVEKAIPEIRESIQNLTDTFSDVEGPFGEYLATTIMSSDFGPQIMHHLSQNIGEAQKIVASGPAAATLALGRLEARFELSAKQEEQKRNKKVTDAREPPSDRTRGVHGQFAVAPDTDNQRAFEREFFKDFP